MPDTSTNIFVVAGMLNLLVGGLSGVPMARGRQSGASSVPKYLTALHMAGLMNGPILISIGFALTISTPSPWVNTASAIVLTFSSLLLICKDWLNWTHGISDEFAEKSLGLSFGLVFGPIFIVGLGLATAGVISGI